MKALVLAVLFHILTCFSISFYNTIKKLAKLKYLPNNFEIIENGDHVVCAISGKLISLENLNYWNVELQEPYFSYVEAHKKKETN